MVPFRSKIRMFSFLMIGAGLGSCAPVAPSIPKGPRLSPKPNAGSTEPRRKKAAEYETVVEPYVVSRKQADDLDLKLSRDYKVIHYVGLDPELVEIKETDSIARLDLSKEMTNLELKVLLVVKGEGKKLDEKSIRVGSKRNDSNLISLRFSSVEFEKGAWPTIKRDLIKVSVYYREKKLEN